MTSIDLRFSNIKTQTEIGNELLALKKKTRKEFDNNKTKMEIFE